jgi:hypothetical protein
VFRTAVAPPSTNTVYTISPKGGQSWAMGKPMKLAWHAPANIHKVRLEISTNNGASWKYIGYAIASKTQSTWTIPLQQQYLTNHARFRITDFNNPKNGTTTGTFRIIQSNQAPPSNAPLKILKPAQNWTLSTGKTHPITWQKPAGVNKVVVQVVWVQGQPWQTVGVTGGNHFSWHVPYGQTFATAGVYIRVVNASNYNHASPPVRVRFFRPAKP